MSAPTPGLLMTLAGIAYGWPEDIPGYVHGIGEPGDWSVVWMPAASPDTAPPNFAYVATSRSTGAIVVAIRGTYPDPLSSAYWDDANQDSPFGPMHDWPNAQNSGAQVSGGTFEGFSSLKAIVGADGKTLEDYLSQLASADDVWITGHSLGGTLAPVLGLWLSSLPAAPLPRVMSFAGMTPGNAAFAALFGPGTPLDGRVVRCFNTLDTVSYGWNDVLGTVGFYKPEPKGGALVDALLALTAARLVGYGYTPVGTPLPLQGVVQPPQVSCELVAYVLENLHQHLPDTYLSLLGAPPLPFTIGFGSVVKRGSAEKSAGSARHLDTVFL
ncbi:lipase family protein [Roseateles terrae]|uniref:Fungal lipase-type domain-containing protein n=1 Tax=Roseateles terrae TaxID=431060 RepID=A0ABR6GRQ4_9BURK|nr:lipase family protein [Roseateles terrae]MBB3194790.1 hypothetical protein [Roseateles terrae]OWQ85938.1 lipase [Roseateles terrae]